MQFIGFAVIGRVYKHYRIETRPFPDGFDYLCGVGRVAEVIRNDEATDGYSREIPYRSVRSADIIGAHLSLAKIRTDKPEQFQRDMVQFAEKSGILGLSEIEHYSRYYSAPLYESPTVQMEPLDAIKQAVDDFQEFMSVLTGKQFDDDVREKVLESLRPFLVECSPNAEFMEETVTDDYFKTKTKFSLRPYWQCPTMLHAAYLQAWQDYVQGDKFRHCGNQKCGIVFRADNSKKIYCSELCKRAVNARSYRSKQKAALVDD